MAFPLGKVGLAVGAAALAVGLGLVGYSYFEAVNSKPLLNPGDAETVALGEAVYAEQCASCHGVNLQGQANWQERLANGRLPAPPHDATGHTWHHPDVQLFALTKQGPAALVGGGYESDMPAFEELLSDEEIAAVLSYIKSTWPPAIRTRHDEINRRME